MNQQNISLYSRIRNRGWKEASRNHKLFFLSTVLALVAAIVHLVAVILYYDAQNSFYKSLSPPPAVPLPPEVRLFVAVFLSDQYCDIASTYT